MCAYSFNGTSFHLFVYLTSAGDWNSQSTTTLSALSNASWYCQYDNVMEYILALCESDIFHCHGCVLFHAISAHNMKKAQHYSSLNHRSSGGKRVIYACSLRTSTSSIICQINAHMRTKISLFTSGDIIQLNHFPRNWPIVRGIHQSPVNSPHKGQWRGALMCSLICGWKNAWMNNLEAGVLRRHRAHYDVTVMIIPCE